MKGLQPGDILVNSPQSRESQLEEALVRQAACLHAIKNIGILDRTRNQFVIDLRSVYLINNPRTRDDVRAILGYDAPSP